MLTKKINQEFIQALKAKDSLRLSVLRLLKTALVEKEKEKGEKPNDQAVLKIIQAEIKKRRQAIEQYQNAGRTDLANQEKKEQTILEEFLPAQLPENELNQIIQQAIRQTGARELKEMGKIMQIVMPQIAGRAPGEQVSTLVKKHLS